MLIVDSDGPSRKALAERFILKGWEVRSAACVAEALRELDLSPDCVVLTLCLPGRAGEEVLEAIEVRGLDPWVVVLSERGNPERLDIVEERFRPDAVFLKPLPPQHEAGSEDGSLPVEGE
jgi:DNA-binding response OmpR family regulator